MTWPTAYSTGRTIPRLASPHAFDLPLVALDFAVIEARVLVHHPPELLRPDQREYYDHLLRSWRSPFAHRRALRTTLRNKP